METNIFTIKNKELEDLIGKAIELRNYLNETISFEIPVSEENKYFVAALNASRETYESLIYLFNENYIYQANIILRSFYELTIRVGVVAEDISGKEFEVLNAEDELDRSKWINSIISYNNKDVRKIEGFEDINKLSERLKTTEQNLDHSLKRLSLERNNFKGYKIEEKCKTLDKITPLSNLDKEKYFEKLYVMLYRYFSGQSHFNKTALLSYIQPENGKYLAKKRVSKDSRAGITMAINLNCLAVYFINKKLRVLDTEQTKKLLNYLTY